MGSPQWEYTNGLVVFLRGQGAIANADQVWQMMISSPSTAGTDEGFRVGDSETEFRSLYAHFSPGDLQQGQVQIRDQKGVRLIAWFASDGRATQLRLDDMTCYDCFANPSPMLSPLKKRP